MNPRTAIRSQLAMRKPTIMLTMLLASIALALPAEAMPGLGAASALSGAAGALSGALAGNPLNGGGFGGLASGVSSAMASAEGLAGGISRRAAAGVGAALGAEAGLAATGTAAGAAVGSVLGAGKAAKVAGQVNVLNGMANGAMSAVNSLGGGLAGIGGALGGMTGIGGRPFDAMNAAAYAGAMGSSMGGGLGVGSASSATAAAAAAASASSSQMGLGVNSLAEGLALAGGGLGVSNVAKAAVREAGAVGAALGAASAINELSAPDAITAAAPVVASSALAVDAAAAAAAAANPATLGALVNKPAMVADALANARAEAAIAGGDMAAHGANNARSASLASNAYRQAKLAGARDKVNIAGTIQNSARISDAAIATHDAATKAEDSLLGSELAVDSAATVLDSDAAYIPPVTNSLLRSLPYGRLGLRNIVPKPLTYPSALLPDVWLNGAPVNYLNVPLRMLPYTMGPNGLPVGPLGPAIGAAAAAGFGSLGQVLQANNGFLINGMVVDPVVAYQLYGQNGIISSSIFPVLANGQLEAGDEIAAAAATNNAIRNGAGSLTTYGGYARANSVGMITGSVSNSNLMPTTAVGTTYPIGSALVIEPRDSYFQDYVDNASSRQNFDEKQQ